MAIEFDEREGIVPDTIPVGLLRAHQRHARRTVNRSAPDRRAPRAARGTGEARWEVWLTRLALVVAVVAGLLAAILMGMTLKPIRVPLLVLGVLGAAAAGAAWVRR